MWCAIVRHKCTITRFIVKDPKRGHWTTHSPAVSKLWRHTWKISLIFYHGPLRCLIPPPWWCVTAAKCFFLSCHMLIEELLPCKRRATLLEDILIQWKCDFSIWLQMGNVRQGTILTPVSFKDHNYHWKTSYISFFFILSSPSLTSVILFFSKINRICFCVCVGFTSLCFIVSVSLTIFTLQVFFLPANREILYLI